MGEKLDGKQEPQLVEIDQVTRTALKNMELSVKPSKEQIESDIKLVRENLLKKLTNPEFKEHAKTAEIFYGGYYNGQLLYGMMSNISPGNIGGYYNTNGDRLFSITLTRDTYSKRTDKVAEGFRRLYQDELKQLGYKEEKGADGIIKTYKIDKEGNKVGNEIDTRSPEYFDLHCSLQELDNIRTVKRIRDVKKQGEPLNKSVLNDALFFRVLTFDDIDFFKSNLNISDERYNQAKEQIAKYYYRLVYLGVIKRAEAKDKTQEYFDEKYISEDTYKRTMKFLEEKK